MRSLGKEVKAGLECEGPQGQIRESACARDGQSVDSMGSVSLRLGKVMHFRETENRKLTSLTSVEKRAPIFSLDLCSC